MKFVNTFFVLLALNLTACMKTSNVVQSDVDGNQTAIIGGEKVSDNIGPFSSTVALVEDDGSGGITSFCTGTLISKDLVVTAAHCLFFRAGQKFQILFGNSMATDGIKSKVVEVSKFLTHSKFKVKYEKKTGRPIISNDIALVHLAEDAPEDYKPIALLDNGWKVRKGTVLTLAGFGLTNETPVQDPNILMSAQVSVVEKESGYIIVDQTTKKGACEGDSGGPAYLSLGGNIVLVGEINGSYQQSPDCRHYAQITDISKHIKTILEMAHSLGADAPAVVSK